ncbi:MAG: hypothetical protein ABIA77_05420 [Candidatus Omnitrophota bacterium]
MESNSPQTISNDIQNTGPAESLQWYFRPWIITIAIFTVGPLGLPLLWFRPRTNVYLKMILTLVIIALAILMAFETGKYYQLIMKGYNDLAGVLG